MGTKVTITPKTISEQLLYSTILIEGLSADNPAFLSSGTGFFFTTKINEMTVELILTNKHVIENCTALKLYLHEAQSINDKWEPTGNFFGIIFNDLRNFWIPHPDPNVDLGALVFSPIRDQIKNQLGKVVFTKSLDKSLIKSDDELKDLSSVADEVLMAGYPTALRDEYNNFPIMRKGIAATHPALDFQNKSIGVVDIACFKGSSGSPILICNEGSFSDKGGNLIVGNKLIFLGLLAAGPSWKTSDKIEIKEIPTANFEGTIENQQMIHLGYYVKAKEILKLCDHIAELAQRSQTA